MVSEKFRDLGEGIDIIVSDFIEISRDFIKFRNEGRKISTPFLPPIRLPIFLEFFLFGEPLHTDKFYFLLSYILMNILMILYIVNYG